MDCTCIPLLNTEIIYSPSELNFEVNLKQTEIQLLCYISFFADTTADKTYYIWIWRMEIYLKIRSMHKMRNTLLIPGYEKLYTNLTIC